MKNNEFIFNKLYKFTEYNDNKINKIKEYINFINNNKICESNIKKDISYHAHHILPRGKTCFPEYKNLNKYKWNKAILTAKNHLKAHKLLFEISLKFIFPSFLKKYATLNEDELKEISKLLSKKNSGKNNPMYKKGYIISGEKNGRHKTKYKNNKEVGRKISKVLLSLSPEKKKIIKEKELKTKTTPKENGLTPNQIGAMKQKETKAKWSDEKRKEIGNKYRQIHLEINKDPIRAKQRKERNYNSRLKNNKFTKYYLYDNNDKLVLCAVRADNYFKKLKDLGITKLIIKKTKDNPLKYHPRVKEINKLKFNGYYTIKKSWQVWQND